MRVSSNGPPATSVADYTAGHEKTGRWTTGFFIRDGRVAQRPLTASLALSAAALALSATASPASLALAFMSSMACLALADALELSQAGSVELLVAGGAMLEPVVAGGMVALLLSDMLEPLRSDMLEPLWSDMLGALLVAGAMALPAGAGAFCDPLLQAASMAVAAPTIRICVNFM